MEVDPAGFFLYESDTSSTFSNILARPTTDITAAEVDDLTAYQHLQVLFDVGDDNSAANGEHRILNAGQTKYFLLRGTIKGKHDGTATNEAVATVMGGDAAFGSAAATQEDATTIDADTEDNFIWSDLNFDQYTTSTATHNLGWFNGYRVPGVGTTSSTPQVVTD